MHNYRCLTLVSVLKRYQTIMGLIPGKGRLPISIFRLKRRSAHHFIIYAKANNLLNTPYELIIKQNNTYNYSGIAKYQHQESAAYTTVQYDQFYARYNLGVKYNF
jgi:hypothetical protein